MAKYDESMKDRARLSELLAQGISPEQAIRQVYPDNSNRSTYLKRWQKNGVWPFGSIGKPESTLDLVADLPTHAGITAPPPVDTPPPTRTTDQADTPTRTRTDQVEFTLSEALSKEIHDIVAAQIAVSVALMKPTIEVVRPVLARSLSQSAMKSFRCPKRLWELAEAKAKQSNMSLNGVLESLLFQWLGEPEELLKK